ncbi:ribonuclease [Chromobacterium subtsugae]|mgnify:CR=1 FL=1|uniref:Ribonuclease n=1 Tax=Chromobacterium subtsugae TaxID=251747 RepID=A0ABS7F964_9NEIS|nr:MULTISPECIES: ribonuclease domain-containing protein [Chromobacterium]KUM02619.1 ribonuclease [Chromobacterium subtsugae]KZE88005.1 ribonuclease [Chromobacterium sp. F49]MBW7565509.1 ribonuclease [Chromobacterium subtsugae]MBW8286641.1 ribonuclease [Chromobacterium subtsugae]WSE90876.1 ribonuclease domain-containing protein [Chromobacterium subtsugae]
MKRPLSLLAALLAAISLNAHAAPGCFNVAGDIARQTGNRLDRQELTEVLQSLSRSGQLPPKFVNKKQARAAGWQPGRSLWSVPALQGKSMGGDRFGNYEKRLPAGQWQEADLGYKGGKRGAYRLVFSRQGQRYVSVDHYNRFIEVPPCQ